MRDFLKNAAVGDKVTVRIHTPGNSRNCKGVIAKVSPRIVLVVYGGTSAKFYRSNGVKEGMSQSWWKTSLDEEQK